MVVDPLALAAEAAALGNPFELLTVDGDALLATPWHRAANQVRERGAAGDGTVPAAWASDRPWSTR